MSNKEKQELIAEGIALLQARLSAIEQSQSPPSPKIPHIRTGAGQNGKILVSKAALLAYFEGGEA